MPLRYNPESEIGKELAKWEKKPEGHPRPFPKMLYKANKRPDGILSVCEAEDSVFNGQLGAAEAFNRKCQRVVENEQELSEALERGWRQTIPEAMDFIEAKEKIISDAAAHRNYEDRNMSEAAKAEAKAVEESTELHVPEIPEKPKARRGRPPKHASA